MTMPAETRIEIKDPIDFAVVSKACRAVFPVTFLSGGEAVRFRPSGLYPQRAMQPETIAL
jgi:hypothetical protein